MPAFGLPLRFLVVLISSFTFRNAELSAWQGIRIIERPLLIFQIERLNRFLPYLCCVFIGFHSCTIPLVSPKASVLFPFYDHPRLSVRADRLYRVPPLPFERLGNQWCLNSPVKAIRVRVRKSRQLLGVRDPDHFFVAPYAKLVVREGFPRKPNVQPLRIRPCSLP